MKGEKCDRRKQAWMDLSIASAKYRNRQQLHK